MFLSWTFVKLTIVLKQQLGRAIYANGLSLPAIYKMSTELSDRSLTRERPLLERTSDLVLDSPSVFGRWVSKLSPLLAMGYICLGWNW